MQEQSELVHRRRWLTLVVVCVCVLMISVDNLVLNVALPSIARDVGADQSDLQWTVDAYVLVFAALLLTAGTLGDRYGRKPTLVIGLVLFGGASAAGALVDDPDALIFARAAMGLGAAAIYPTTLSIITNVFPPAERTRAIAAWGGVGALGVVIGPLLGGALLEVSRWPAIFWINVPVALGALLAAIWLVPDSRDPTRPRLDVIGAVLSAVGLGALVFAIIEAPPQGLGSGVVLAAFALALGALAAFGIWERRRPQPLLDLTVFKNRTFTGAAGGLTLMSFALLGSMFLLPQYLQFVQGRSALEAALLLLPNAVGFMIGMPLVPRLIERFGSRPVLSAGLGIVALALAIWSVKAVAADDVVRSVVLVGFSFGLSWVMVPATDAVMSALPPAKAGVGSAINDTTRELGGALGIAILGSVAAAVYTAQLDGALAGLPPSVRAEAGDSLAAALAIAAAQGGQAGAQVAAAARDAFASGMSLTFLIAAGVAAIGAVATWKIMPATPRLALDAEPPIAPGAAEPEATRSAR